MKETNSIHFLFVQNYFSFGIISIIDVNSTVIQICSQKYEGAINDCIWDLKLCQFVYHFDEV